MWRIATLHKRIRVYYVYLTIVASSGRKAWKTWVHVQCLAGQAISISRGSKRRCQPSKCHSRSRAASGVWSVACPPLVLLSTSPSTPLPPVLGAFALFFNHTPLFIVSVSEWPLSLVDLRLLPIYPIRPTHSPSPKPGMDHRRGMTQTHVLLRTTSASFPFPCLPAGDIYFLSYLRCILERQQ
jgi:hypothetical protein